MTQHTVAKISDIPNNCGKMFIVGEEHIAVFNKDGTFYAIDNSCTHRGGPLADGELDGTLITCPWHCWRFDVTNGECPDIPGEKIKTYVCKVEGDNILVEI